VSLIFVFCLYMVCEVIQGKTLSELLYHV
jgi:hypothetical protein